MQPIPASIQFAKSVINAENIGERTAAYIGAPVVLGVMRDLTLSFRHALELKGEISDSKFESFLIQLSLQGKSTLALESNQVSISGSTGGEYAMPTPRAFRIEDEYGTPIKADDDVIMRAQLGAHGKISTLESIVSKQSTNTTQQPEPSFLSHPVHQSFIWER